MRCFLVTIALLVFGFTARAADVRYPDDATLRAVQFVDSGKEGWAVGDEPPCGL